MPPKTRHLTFNDLEVQVIREWSLLAHAEPLPAGAYGSMPAIQNLLIQTLRNHFLHPSDLVRIFILLVLRSSHDTKNVEWLKRLVDDWDVHGHYTIVLWSQSDELYREIQTISSRARLSQLTHVDVLRMVAYCFTDPIYMQQLEQEYTMVCLMEQAIIFANQ